MTVLSIPVPEELRVTVAAQADRAGLSVDQYLLMIVARHVGAQEEAERHFALRAARSVPGRGLEILARVGTDQPPEPGDEIPPDIAERLAARRAAGEAW